MCSADYFVYYPESTPRLYTGIMTYLGIFFGLTFSELMGAGLAAGSLTDKSWAAALEVGTGNLFVEVFAPLGSFGKFVSVVMALGPSKCPPVQCAAVC